MGRGIGGCILTIEISFICDTNDAKSPRSPLTPSRMRYRIESLEIASHLPVVRLRERGLLVAEKPSMTVRGVNDVDISPFQCPSRWGQRRRRICSSRMFMDVSVAVSAGPGSGNHKKYSQETRQHDGSRCKGTELC